jgi:hypothetical protein
MQDDGDSTDGVEEWIKEGGMEAGHAEEERLALEEAEAALAALQASRDGGRKGPRKAVMCSVCGQRKPREHFSGAQYKRKARKRKCKECVKSAAEADPFNPKAQPPDHGPETEGSQSSLSPPAAASELRSAGASGDASPDHAKEWDQADSLEKASVSLINACGVYRQCAAAATKPSQAKDWQERADKCLDAATKTLDFKDDLDKKYCRTGGEKSTGQLSSEDSAAAQALVKRRARTAASLESAPRANFRPHQFGNAFIASVFLSPCMHTSRPE